MLLYPVGVEVKERSKVSLFVNSELNEDLIAEEIFSRKPFGFWMKEENKLLYTGPHWKDIDYGDYFPNENIVELYLPPNEIIFRTYYDVCLYYNTFHPNIVIPSEFVVLSGLESIR